jgi:superfamily I DNA and RNA helicase
LIKLTEEQFDRLNMASENPRILLKGGAGTGKTVICYEIARREALLGKRVLFTCFNSNLCKYLKTNNEIDNLHIVHFHKFLSDSLRKQGLEPPKSNNQNLFFTELLPEAFCEMMESIGGPKYDLLVMDEGQDLIRYEYLMCMDLVLEGGLKKGRWFIAYDPNQNIYNPEFEMGMSWTAANSRLSNSVWTPTAETPVLSDVIRRH